MKITVKNDRDYETIKMIIYNEMQIYDVDIQSDPDDPMYKTVEPS